MEEINKLLIILGVKMSQKKNKLFLLTMIILFFVVFMLCLSTTHAQTASQQAQPYKLPSDPILIVNTGTHISRINSIDVDRYDRYLVTGSDDKTVRIWSLQENKIFKRLRFPIGDGTQGIIYAVSISPDGDTVVFGGRTYTVAEINYHIYVYDLNSGIMKKRIGDLPGRITQIKFSPDGSFFVVGLAKGGIRIYDAKDLTLKASTHSSFTASIDGLDIDKKGRIIVSTSDGFLLSFDRTPRLLESSQKQSEIPTRISISPDGSLLAVCYSESNTINVFSTDSLEKLYSVDTTDLKGNFFTVAWSKKGQLLFAGGTIRDENGAYSVVVWNNMGKGPYFKKLPAGTNSILSLVSLNDGGFASGSADTNVTAYSYKDINSEKFGFLFSKSDLGMDFRHGNLLISEDGEAIRVNKYRFSLRYGQYDSFEKIYKFYTSKTHPKKINLTDWKNNKTPKLNGKPLDLEGEISRTIAISHDEESFIIVSDYYLYCFDARGSRKWKKRLTSLIKAINISKNGKVAVSAHADGIIRWHSMKDGSTLALLYMAHPDELKNAWALWTPKGYYKASPEGEKLIGWHLNNGWDKEAYFYRISRFRDRFYNEEIFDNLLSNIDKISEVAKSAYDNPVIRKNELSLPPVVRILEPKDNASTMGNKITVTYVVESLRPDERITVKPYVNGRPLATARDIVIEPKPTGIQPLDRVKGALKRTIEIPLDCEQCVVSLIARSNSGVSEPASVNIINKSKKEETSDRFVIKPKLYILSVGVSKYKNSPENNLIFPHKDASDFVNTMLSQKGKLYREVEARLLTNEKATRTSIIDGLQWLKRSVTQHDVAMIFMSSHGTNETGQYYFIPYDYVPGKLESSSVLFTYIKDTVSSIPGKVLVFLDTCHAGDVLGGRRAKSFDTNTNKIVNELVSAENGAVVFTSSTGRQKSYEDEKWGNGAFTKALIEGLTGKADMMKKGKITINMLDLYISERVKELTQGTQTPTTAKPDTIQDFPIAVR